MRKLKKFLVILSVGFIFSLLGCENPIGGNNNSGSGGSSGDSTRHGLQIDFTNHQGQNAGPRFNNDSNETVVGFFGDIRPENLRLGIPAGAQNHGASRAAFSSLSSGVMTFVTLEQLNASNADWAMLNETAFARIPVIFNPNADPSSPQPVFTISGRLRGRGSYQLEITSGSNLTVEVREGGHNGTVLGTVWAGMQTIRLRVESGTFNLHPVIRKFNASLGELSSIYPVNAAGQPLFVSMVIENPAVRYTLNVQDLLDIMEQQGWTTGTGRLIINNQNAAGAVRLLEGNTIRLNSSGESPGINAQQSRAFNITMPSVGNDFAEFVDISTFRVGPEGREVPIIAIDSYGNESTNIRFFRDHIFTATVQGNHNIPQGQPGSLRAVINLDEVRSLSLNDLQ